MSEERLKGKSILAFPDEYVCVDVETTGLDYEWDEVIEIGAIRIKDGQVVDSFSSLIKPRTSHSLLTFGALHEMGYQDFSDISSEETEEYFNSHLIPEFITDLTGITNEMLLEADPADKVLPAFWDYIKDSVLVGHNVNFDINFLYDALLSIDKILSNDFIDTMRISRKLFPEMEHHRLSDMVEKLDVSQAPAHRAEADALATAACFEKMKQLILDSGSYDDFIKNYYAKKTANYNKKLQSILPTVDVFDETHPIFGKVVVFTGTLSSMGRKDAFQLVANLGGYPEDTITKKTNFLVVGEEEFKKTVKDGKTKKMLKAESYQLKGVDIVTLSEKTFFEMIK